MNKIKIVFVTTFATMLFVTACQDDPKFGSLLKSSDLKYSVTQQSGYDNKVFLENQTPQVIPFWDYGSGTSIREKDTVVFPFAGEHEIKFTAYGRAGAVEATSKVITVTENDPNFFSDPRWNLLTNGISGKTWVFDGTAPIGFYGSGYIAHDQTGNDWSYFPSDCPDWSGFGCGTNWGEMTFNLDGDFNYSVTQKSLTTSDMTTTAGKFSYTPASNSMKFTGAMMLYSGNYSAVKSWVEAYVFDVTETELYLSVIRDDGAILRFKYVVKS